MLESTATTPTGMYHCPEPDCGAMYLYQIHLDKHLKTREHHYGKSNSIQTKKSNTSGTWAAPKGRINPDKIHDTMVMGVESFEQHLASTEKDRMEEEERQHQESTATDQVVSDFLLKLGKEIFYPGIAIPASRRRSKRTLGQWQFILQWIMLGTKSVAGERQNHSIVLRQTDINFLPHIPNHII